MPPQAPTTAALLMLADSRLPAGGHAHSGGLEPAVAARRVSTVEDLEVFLRGRLRTAGLVAAALAAAACFGASRVDTEFWTALDAEADARTPSPALRLASRRQGRVRCWADWPRPLPPGSCTTQSRSARSVHRRGATRSGSPAWRRTCRSPARRAPRSGCAGSTRWPCTPSWPGSHPRWTASVPRPPQRPAARCATCRAPPPRCSTCSPRPMLGRRCACLPPDHDHDHGIDPGPPGRRAAGGATAPILDLLAEIRTRTEVTLLPLDHEHDHGHGSDASPAEPTGGGRGERALR